MDFSCTRVGNRLILLLLLGGVFLLACGSPRKPRRTPGPPAYPTPLFTADLPDPGVIGLRTAGLNQRRQDLDRVTAVLTGPIEYIEYFAAHPAVLAVHYHIARDTDRVIRLWYEFRPTVQTDLGLRLAILADLRARYGLPIVAEDAAGTPGDPSGRVLSWATKEWHLRWYGDMLEVTRAPSRRGGDRAEGDTDDGNPSPGTPVSTAVGGASR